LRRRPKNLAVLAVALILTCLGIYNIFLKATWSLLDDGVLWKDTSQGVVAGRLSEPGPAARAGVRVGDVLLGLDGEEILAAEISRAHRFTHQLAVVLLDLDRFKEINDSFGHAAGDVMLHAVSRLLTSLARQGDTVARWGGEEFVVVLPETDLAGAQRFAERLRRTIEAHAVGEMKTSASCGVATMLPEDSVEELLGAADQALYQAKSNGRNRTESAVRGPSPAVA
jgi:diguanylate cyclase (GGDEF)-like protein